MQPCGNNEEILCISVPKVYDWVARVVEVPVQSFTGAAGLENLNFNCSPVEGEVPCSQLTAHCFLTNADGVPIEPTSQGAINCQELTNASGRKDVQVILPSGECTVLQKVTVLKQGYYVVEISNMNNSVCRSTPQLFSVYESFLLCAPEGTTINCSLADFDCNTFIQCGLDAEGNPAFQSLEVYLTLCQNVQLCFQCEKSFVNAAKKQQK